MRRSKNLVESCAHHHRTREFLKEIAEDTHRESKQSEQRRSLHDIASVKTINRHLPRTNQQQRDDSKVRQGIDHRVEHSTNTAEPNASSPKFVCSPFKPFDFLVFATKCLHHKHAVEGFVCDPTDMTDSLLHDTQWLFGPAGVHPIDDCQQREEHHCHQHQEPVDRRQADDRKNHERHDTNAEWEWINDFA